MQPAPSYRGALRLLLVLAYLSLAFASLTHPASHMLRLAIDDAGQSNAAERAVDQSQRGKQSSPNSADHGDRTCFFCLHGPTLLLLPTFLSLFIARVSIRNFASRMPERVIVPPQRSIVSLRAPPALA